jgi:clan AA aspartic protease (TIGR02281 family)
MKKYILLILLMICLVNSNLFSQTVIKMKRDGGISIIPCKVNGLNLNFIFDTGASNVSLSMTEATFMLKNGYLSESDILGTNKFSDATGKISEGVIINIKEIEIAGLKLYNVKASIVTNNKAPLLLGQSAIGKLGKIQLDLEQNTLTILSGIGSYDFSDKIQQRQQFSNNRGIETNHPVVGKPIILGNLEVAERDFPYTMDWDHAMLASTSLGDNWRLPTKEELDYLYKNKEMVGGFKDVYYWSSTEYDSRVAWVQFFYTLHDGPQYSNYKFGKYHVRAVRFF